MSYATCVVRPSPVAQLVVVHVIDTLGSGGAERLLVTNLRRLKRSDLRHVVVTVSAADDHWRAEIEKLGIEVKCLEASRWVDLPVAIWRLRRILQTQRADVVHSHLLIGNLVGRIAGRSAAVGVISSIHSLGHEVDVWRGEGFHRPWRQEVLRFLDAATARLCADRLVAVSPCVHESIRRRLRFPAARMTVIPNPVELADDVDRPDALPTPSEARLVLTVARIVPQKGIVDSVLAISKLSGPAAPHLLIAGSTVNAGYTRTVLDEARRLGVSSRVHLLGPRSDIPALLRRADLFVLASRSEGFGIALAEAMAAGRPCVVTSIQAFRDLVEDGRTGLLVDVGDVDALADAMRDLLRDSDRARKLGDAAREDILRRLDPEALAVVLEELYHDVVTERAGPTRN